jgi:Flp pilus assembly protein TadB
MKWMMRRPFLLFVDLEEVVVEVEVLGVMDEVIWEAREAGRRSKERSKRIKRSKEERRREARRREVDKERRHQRKGLIKRTKRLSVEAGHGTF